VIIVPGNHDINRKECESYFNRCEARDETPSPPYTAKWNFFCNDINMLLHGHTHDGKITWMNSNIPVISTGSAGLKADVRPEEVRKCASLEAKNEG
jgi:calcineurin-like phosphoesterase family protein